MEFEKVVTARHSVRNFSDQAVSETTIRNIVQLAQHAPSWVNSQPWKVYVATAKPLQEIKTAFLKNETDGLKSQPDFPVMHRDDWSSDTQANMKQWRHEIVHHFENFDQAHAKMTDASETLDHSPVILYLTIPKNSSLWSVFDAGSFAQTIMLAAKDKGLDTIPTYNSVRYPETVRQILNIPTDETLVVGISLGYQKDALINTYQSKREPVDNILKFIK